MISFADFDHVDMRVGRIVEVQEFPQARKPSYKLRIDFGPEIGVKRSSAQLPPRYSKDELQGRLVICVVNFPPKQIGPFLSEVLRSAYPTGAAASCCSFPNATCRLADGCSSGADRLTQYWCRLAHVQR